MPTPSAGRAPAPDEHGASTGALPGRTDVRAPVRRLSPIAACVALATALASAFAPSRASEASQGEASETEVASYIGTIAIERFAYGLQHPWSLKFLPDGSMLVSEKQPPQLRRVSAEGALSPPLEGLPTIYAEGNGGLLGLALDPAFAVNGTIYFAFTEPGEGESAGLAVARATLGATRLSDVEVIFRQEPKVADIRNFGGRLLFAPDGTLLVMTGDRFALPLVQQLDNTIGKLVRITTDGEPAPGNPFLGREDADPRIYAYGQRNMQAAAFHPETGALWLAEFGPWGGDELYVVEPGANYGWPLVSWGRHYEGGDIPDPPTRPDLAGALFHWNPVISPASMVFYGGDEFPEWQGNLLVAGLTSRALVRLTLRGDRVISEERIGFDGRLRDVVEGPDGAVYIIYDRAETGIIRLTLKTKAGEG